jgi:pimeloyl-ACP methyl ester carboxylesterase
MKYFQILFLFSSFFLSAQTEEIWQIKLKNGQLEGSLLLADSLIQTPVVLIIAGSGPTDRNGNNPVMKNNSLKMLAFELAKNQISSLRIDKRTIGKSKIDSFSVEKLRFDDLIKDAVLWINKLKKDKRFSKIIVLGHSQGALVGLMASKKTKVNAYISVAGAGFSIDKILKKQLSKSMKIIKTNAYQIIDSLSNRLKPKKIHPLLQSIFNQKIQNFLISWMKYKPEKEIIDLKIPILIIQGDTDFQVSIEDANNLHKTNKNSKLVIIKGMNHILKPAVLNKEKNIATYYQPDLSLHKKLIPTIVKFIKQH